MTRHIDPARAQFDMFIARYPGAHAFSWMITDPDCRLAVVHYQAGVPVSHLSRCGPPDAGSAFG